MAKAIHNTQDDVRTLCGIKISSSMGTTNNANKTSCARCIKKLDKEIPAEVTDLLDAGTKASKPGTEDKELKKLHTKIKKNFASRVKYNNFMDQQIGIKQHWSVKMESPLYIVVTSDVEGVLINIGQGEILIGTTTEEVMEQLGIALFADPTFFSRQDERRAKKKASRERTWASVYKDKEADEGDES
jgi:hypothetical protein